MKTLPTPPKWEEGKWEGEEEWLLLGTDDVLIAYVRREPKSLVWRWGSRKDSGVFISNCLHDVMEYVRGKVLK